MNILKTIFRNILEFIFVAWAVLTIVYFLINSIPGSNQMTAGLSDTQKHVMEVKLGLDKPLIIRYFTYLGHLLTGDLGISTSFRPGVPINDFLWKRFLVSFSVGSIAMIVTLIIGIPLGVLVGRSPGKLMDASASFIIAIMISIPGVVFGLLFLLMGKGLGIPYVYDSKQFVTWILPALALGILPSTTYIRYIRTGMNQEINSMHAKFAYLKGASRTRFVIRHALKPALFPVVTFLPMAILSTFLGGIFIERYFQIPGSGGLLISAIQTNDYNIILILVTIYSAMTVAAYSIRDVMYKVMDPRMRRS